MMRSRCIKRKLFNLFAIVLFTIACTNCGEKKSFHFVGVADEHPENFDEDIKVTDENVRDLYKYFLVFPLYDNEYYLIVSKGYYENSRFLSRLIKMQDGVQVAAQTFYDYQIDRDNIVKLKDKLVVGLNSLGTNYFLGVSSHTCKVVILSENLHPICGNVYSCKDGLAGIEEIFQNSDSTFLCNISCISKNYQFCADLDFNILATDSKESENVFQSHKLNVNSIDWCNDISEAEWKKMRGAQRNRQNLQNSSDSIINTISADSKTNDAETKSHANHGIPNDFVLVPSGILRKREQNENLDYYYKSIEVDSFYICKYELTQGQYHKMIGELKPENYTFDMDPYSYDKVKKVQGDNIPVICTYLEFVKYCNLRSKSEGYDGFYEIQGNQVKFKNRGNGYRLLFENEWIFAAKGGQNNEQFRFVGSNKIKEVAWYGGNSGNQPHPVGEKIPNSLNIFDMAGNVNEMLETKSKQHDGYPRQAGSDYLSWISSGDEFSTEDTNRWYNDLNRRSGTRIAFIPKRR